MTKRQPRSSGALPVSEPSPPLAAFESLGDYRLRLSFVDGHVCEVDLAPHLAIGTAALAPTDRQAFQRAMLGKNGQQLGWPDTSQCLTAGQLRLLAEQQAAEAELLQFWRCLHDSAWNLEALAAAWGLCSTAPARQHG